MARVLETDIEGEWIIGKGNVYSYEFHRDGKLTGFGAYPFEWIRKRFEEGESLADKYAIITGIGRNF